MDGGNIIFSNKGERNDKNKNQARSTEEHLEQSRSHM